MDDGRRAFWAEFAAALVLVVLPEIVASIARAREQRREEEEAARERRHDAEQRELDREKDQRVAELDREARGRA